MNDSPESGFTKPKPVKDTTKTLAEIAIASYGRSLTPDEHKWIENASMVEDQTVAKLANEFLLIKEVRELVRKEIRSKEKPQDSWIERTLLGKDENPLGAGLVFVGFLLLIVILLSII